MTDQIVVDATNTGAETPVTPTDLISKTEAQKAFAARDEAKAINRELAEKLAKLEADAESRRQADLTEVEKLREDNLKLKTLADRSDALENTIKVQVESLIESIPEAQRSLVPDIFTPEQKLNYINANRSILLTAPIVKPNTLQTGPAAATPNLDDLTADQKEACKRWKVSEEDYRKYL